MRPGALPLSHAPMPREAVEAAAMSLHNSARRYMKAADVMTRLALRLTCEAKPGRVLSAMQNTASKELIGSDEIAAELDKLVAAMPEDWQRKRAAAGEQYKRQKFRDCLDRACDTGPAPEWTYAAIMERARQRRDVLSAAIAFCEQRPDGDEKESVAQALGEYMTGKSVIYWIELALERAGFNVAGATVIPLVPRKRA